MKPFNLVFVSHNSKFMYMHTGLRQELLAHGLG